jgi:hypothetical protein
MAVQVFEFKVKHVADRSNVVLYTLSRDLVTHCDDDEEDELQIQFPIFMITETDTCYEPYLEEIMNYCTTVSFSERIAV